MVEAARSRIKEEMMRVGEEAKAEIQRRVETARKESEKEVRALLRRTENQKDTIRDRALKKQEQAISLILERILR